MQSMAPYMYSVVVPVYNEEDAVAALHADLVRVLDSLEKPYEIIFVDDGSTDNTSTVLQSLTPITVITFRKNFGQTAAFDAGFQHATGEFIITLDGDGQNPPSEIPKLIRAQKEQGWDVVSGWRKERKDTFVKRFVSRGANLLRHLILDDTIHDSGCSLKLYSRECFADTRLIGEMHRFIPQILSWKGFAVGEVPVKHLPRTTGRTKYNWKRTVKGFVDIAALAFWSRFSGRPLHLFGGLGLLMISLSAVALIILFALKIFYDKPLTSSILPHIVLASLQIGFVSFVGGILADILVKGYFERHSFYSIKKVHSSPTSSSNKLTQAKRDRVSMI